MYFVPSKPAEKEKLNMDTTDKEFIANKTNRRALYQIDTLLSRRLLS